MRGKEEELGWGSLRQQGGGSSLVSVCEAVPVSWGGFGKAGVRVLQGHHHKGGEGPGAAPGAGLTQREDGRTGMGSAAPDRVLDLHRSHGATRGPFLAVTLQGELRQAAGGALDGSWDREGWWAPGCASWDLRGPREGRAPGLVW